jgi:alpha-1,2-mannosyltransferase
LRSLRRPSARTGVYVFIAVVAVISFIGAVAILAARAEVLDYQVYRAGGRALWDGHALYDHPVWEELSFVYPPLAAVMFIPFALLPAVAGEVAVIAGNLALLLFVVVRSWMAVWAESRRRIRPLEILWVSGATAGGVFWIEAVHTTVYIGQINLMLMALVLADLLRSDSARTKGIGVGIAAGLKLTPLIFVAYLLVTRRFRAAAVAVAAFLSTVAVGFLVAPRDSRIYWLGGTFADTERIKLNDMSPQNQSLRGMLLRSGLDPAPASWTWLGLSAVILIGAAVFAVWTNRRGNELLAVTSIGLTSALVSPWSWGHHWVWLAPFAVFMLGVVTQRPRRGADYMWTIPGVLLVLTFPKLFVLAVPSDQLIPPQVSNDAIGFILGNIYLLIFMCIAICAAFTVFVGREGGLIRRSTEC